MHVYGEISGVLSGHATISGTLAAAQTISGTLTIPEAVLPPAYAGPYTVTPSAVAQIVGTEGFYMTEDLVVEAIPSNYGLITWDGSTLTVS